MKYAWFVLYLSLVFHFKVQAQTTQKKPVRIAVAGLTHGHVHWILNTNDHPDVEVVGIFETDTALIRRYTAMHHLNPAIIYHDLNKMLDAVKPEAVVAFGSVYEHMAVVEACAPRKIHVMVEKPLATNMAHANRMEELARKNNIYLLTNFETSWYPATAKTYNLVTDSNYVGTIRRVVFHDGHQGPKEIGVNPEFFEWLTDPIQNGGGALTDFGCYGANLITYLTKGERPTSVTAVARSFKPSIYPKVDDDAIILIQYPSAECVIQASWNWPFSRKDMEVYGDSGYVVAVNSNTLRMKRNANEPEKTVQVAAQELNVYQDPFAYLADVVSGRISAPQYGLYSLPTNVMVVKILEAARESAKTGKTVILKYD